jgi:hypothetical protein
MSFSAPRGEHEIARRLAELERNPDVMIWTPRNSPSGHWEAMVGDESFDADAPSTLCDRADAALKALRK